MLIFVQVYRTINKKFVSTWSLGTGRTNESNRINKVNEAECIWRLVLLKSKCSWSDDVSSETNSSEARSPDAEVHQKMRDLKLQRLFKEFNHA